MVMSKRILILLLMIPALSCCIDMSMTITENPSQEQVEKDIESKTTPTLKYFAFLKKNNPSLSRDIIFDHLDNNNLFYVLEEEGMDKQKLVVSFEVSNGQLYYNGNQLTSDVDSIYCSSTLPAILKLQNLTRTRYHSIRVIPYAGIPVIIVSTDGNRSIESKEYWQKAEMMVYGMDKCPDKIDSIQVKLHGNGTAVASIPKKAFNIKFEKRTSVLGMKKHKRWVALANYRDRTLIRNAVASRLGKLSSNLEWIPKFEFAMVILNGQFNGLYQISEQIKIDKNRLAIDELDSTSTNITGGYLLELDSKFDEPFKFMTQYQKWPVNIKSPDDKVCTEEQLNYITDYYNTIEDHLAKKEYDKAYELIDLDSFIDYFIVENLANNIEFGNPNSFYNYKKRDGKLYAGPIWDFEFHSFFRRTSGIMTTHIYSYLAGDENFNQKLYDRWNELVPVYESNIYNYIDSLRTVLKIPAQLNEDAFPECGGENDDEHLTWDGALDNMKDFLQQRIVFLNKTYKELLPQD